MQNYVDILEKNEQFLRVQLKSKEMFDVNVFDQFQYDELCLGCFMNNVEKQIITYNISGFISLKAFLEQVTFKEEEGYIFLVKLFTLAIQANQNKPIVFDPDFIFVNFYGDQIRFVPIPLKIEHRLLQKDILIDWIDYLCKNFKTTSYEICGYLLSFKQSEEFSLPNLILGLEALRTIYYPNRFYIFKKKKSFRLKEPVSILISNTQFETSFSPPSNEKTQLIGFSNDSNAYLEKGEEKYILLEQTMFIGRSMACDIRLDQSEVSLKHAKITFNENKYYIQDLKSMNHTYLNGKQVLRRMRLKDGMLLQFGNVEFIFHQV